MGAVREFQGGSGDCRLLVCFSINWPYGYG